MSRQLPAPVRISSLLALVGLFSLLGFTGCGKSGPDADVAADQRPAAVASGSGTAVPAGATDFNAAVNTVSQFLDAIRRGGDSNRAHSLLTSHAVKVLESLGRTIQPIGSPDATFKVTRGEPVEDHPGMALVHSTWSEPTAEGTTESYQVVWAMQFEQGSWRISGLAMELDPAEDPMIVDFEDAVQMAELFRSEADAPSTDTARTAEAIGTETPGTGSF
ncbi:MAG: hypothetical protein EA381_02445 [Planctomycetaceae bacterium]|nr:MAG: hypothetical protein EA381_02445 [Planctomycetaceae bacterium]